MKKILTFLILIYTLFSCTNNIENNSANFPIISENKITGEKFIKGNLEKLYGLNCYNYICPYKGEDTKKCNIEEFSFTFNNKKILLTSVYDYICKKDGKILYRFYLDNGKDSIFKNENELKKTMNNSLELKKNNNISEINLDKNINLSDIKLKKKIYIFGTTNSEDIFLKILNKLEKNKKYYLSLDLKNINLSNNIKNILNKENITEIYLDNYTFFGNKKYIDNKGKENYLLGWYSEDKLIKFLKKSKYINKICIGTKIYNCYIKDSNGDIKIEYNIK